MVLYGVVSSPYRSVVVPARAVVVNWRPVVRSVTTVVSSELVWRPNVVCAALSVEVYAVLVVGGSVLPYSLLMGVASGTPDSVVVYARSVPAVSSVAPMPAIVVLSVEKYRAVVVPSLSIVVGKSVRQYVVVSSLPGDENSPASVVLFGVEVNTVVVSGRVVSKRGLPAAS